MTVIRILFVLAALCALAPAATSADALHLRLGLVKYGTAAWEVDSIRRHHFDGGNGIVIDGVELANPAAGEVALMAGGVDAIMTDWLWVARQRLAGQPLTFVPHNAILGDLVVPADSPVRTLADLDGKRLGVAGGPIDKSWLLLRAYSRKSLGWDLAQRAVPVYGAPPLLSQELEAGRIDALLTYWPFAARLGLRGYRSLFALSDVIAGLGLDNPVPMLGFAISELWISGHPGGLQAFLAAIGQADAVMASSDEEWRQLGPLTAAENDAVLSALRDRFRHGLVPTWTPAGLSQTATLLALMAETGGNDLTGGARTIPAGTFWTGDRP
ncbi:ABC transporter substrate-binding protein [Telmatospirillum siberiense]|uniref:ABC transporter substrate-binding protein n=1 Tax=Telmatospirillum siberiense TaxID=382514 RepID=A0A2N3PUT0_9PROT|nr:ABC transporter substrate-binding protein [Telmatospirillum siberiense]PKU24148.1 ABC transporter substrate-binding protein [Telmatospirillum siberiense]